MRIALVAAAVMVLMAPAAAAQTPPPLAGPSFGGGTAFILRGSRAISPGTLVSLKIAGDGASARAYVAVNLDCGYTDLFEAWAFARTRVVNGAVDFKSGVLAADRGLRATVKVSGQIGADSATGTVTTKGRYRGHRCVAIGGTGFTAKRGGFPAGAGPIPPSSTYSGTIDALIVDGFASPLTLYIGPDSKRVLSAGWTAPVSCTRTGRTWWDNESPPAVIQADGSFAANERFSVGYNRERVRFRVELSGRIIGTTVTGTLRVRETVKRRGKLYERCDSGPLTWSATAS